MGLGLGANYLIEFNGFRAEYVSDTLGAGLAKKRTISHLREISIIILLKVTGEATVDQGRRRHV